jgi:hypothetical protein
MSTSGATDHEPTGAYVRGAGAHGAQAHDLHDPEASHEEDALGPIDWPAWRAAIVGVAVAAVMVLLFALAAWG